MTQSEKAVDISPLVSVIIPCFNVESFIEATLASVLGSTYQKFEIILIDDGSNDRTPEILERYSDIHPNIRVIKQQNRGPGAARNAGAQIAKGEAIAFLDADDIWDIEKLEKQIAYFQRGILLYTDRINFGSTGNLAEKQSSSVNQPEGSVFNELFLVGNFVTLSSVLLHKKDFFVAGGFDEDPMMRGVEDWDLWLRISKSVKFKLIPEPLTRYRCHEGGLSKRIISMHISKRAVLQKHALDATESDLSLALRNALLGSAFFAKNQRSYALGFKLYCKCIAGNPTNLFLYKQAIKCLLRTN